MTRSSALQILRRVGALHICVDAGRDPSFFIGAILQDFGTNARPGGGDLVVVEADEYDRSFLQLTPQVAIVTNLEHDHPDIYPTLGEVQEAFLTFLRQVRAIQHEADRAEKSAKPGCSVRSVLPL